MSLFGANIVPLPRRYPDCPRCGRDLIGLAERALFCPGCGHRLRRGTTFMDRARAGALLVLRVVSLGRFGQLKPLAAVDPGVCCTPILIGYASALFNLGWRYERGGGASRNLPEAIRCYRKSARLGNLDAMVRLAPADSNTPKRVVPLDR